MKTHCARTRLVIGFVIFTLLLLWRFPLGNAILHEQQMPIQSGWAPFSPDMNHDAILSWSAAATIPATFGDVAVMNNAEKLFVLIDAIADPSPVPPTSSYPPGDYFWMSAAINQSYYVFYTMGNAFGGTSPGALCYSHSQHSNSYPGDMTGCLATLSALSEGFGPSISSKSNHRFYELELTSREMKSSPGSTIAFDIFVHSESPAFDRCIAECPQPPDGFPPAHLTFVQLAQGPAEQSITQSLQTTTGLSLVTSQSVQPIPETVQTTYAPNSATSPIQQVGSAQIAAAIILAALLVAAAIFFRGKHPQIAEEEDKTRVY